MNFKEFLAISVCVLSFQGIAQLDLQVDGSPYVSGSQVDYNVSYDVTANITFANNSNDTIYLKVMRAIINELPSWSDHLSWANDNDIFGGDCCIIPSGNPAYSPSTFAFAPGESGYLTPTILPGDDSYGCSLYRYYFMDGITSLPVDSVDVNVCQIASINEPTDALISMYPNPTSELVNFKMNSSENLTLEMVNSKGEVVLHLESFDASTPLSLKGLESGRYIVSFIDGNNVLRRESLILSK